MTRTAQVFELAVISSFFLFSCASTRTLTKEQRRNLIRDQKLVHRMLPTLQSGIAKARSRGALIVFFGDSSPSGPFYAKSPIEGVRQWLRHDHAANMDHPTAEAAAFVFARATVAPTEWYSPGELEEASARQLRTKAALHSLDRETLRLQQAVKALKVQSSHLASETKRLKEFSVLFTNVAVSQQSLLDGSQDELGTLRASLTEMQKGLAAEEENLSSEQTKLETSLSSISTNLTTIQAELGKATQ